MFGVKTYTEQEIIPYLKGSRVKMLNRDIYLAMTMVVRDEEDILEKNIEYHLGAGVDKIIVMDNGSVDGTMDILDKYQKKGVVDYEVKKERNFSQGIWMSQLMSKATKKYGADFVINSDADEFWVPRYFNLKTMILADSDFDVISVAVRNYLPIGRDKTQFFDFGDFLYCVSKTIPIPSLEERKVEDLWLYEYARKLITSSKVTGIGYGNDTAVSSDSLKKILTNNILIHHFPVRSWENFERKVKIGGENLARSQNKDLTISWQRRWWYQIYLDGNLKDEYRRQTMIDKLDELLAAGIIKKERSICG